MIVTFKSSASGDVIMFGDVAQRMLEIMGKEAGEKGIVTVEDLPDAIARLHAAIAADKASPRAEKAGDDGEREFIGLAQRAVPLLELFELSLKKNRPVTWGI